MARIGTPLCEDRFRRARAARFRHRRRPAREDDRLGLQPLERLARLRERMDLAIDSGLAHPPCDELGHLGAEVDDEDEVVLHRAPLAESAPEAQWRASPLNGSVHGLDVSASRT